MSQLGVAAPCRGFVDLERPEVCVVDAGQALFQLAQGLMAFNAASKVCDDPSSPVALTFVLAWVEVMMKRSRPGHGALGALEQWTRPVQGRCPMASRCLGRKMKL